VKDNDHAYETIHDWEDHAGRKANVTFTLGFEMARILQRRGMISDFRFGWQMALTTNAALSALVQQSQKGH
jgi:hypothetical protein